MIRVKICGIRRIQDARAAIAAGADALGLLVGREHPSPDFIEPEAAAVIVTLCPPFVTPVLVTHLTDPSQIHALARDLGVSTIQLHGDSTPGEVAILRGLADPGWRLLKACHLTEAGHLDLGDAFLDFIDGFVLDSHNPATGQVGGTGLLNDWDLAARFVARHAPLPVILAGGLRPDNVAAAIARVAPFAVDVNSGTKGVDGYKDLAKVNAFVRAAKTASWQAPGQAS